MNKLKQIGKKIINGLKEMGYLGFSFVALVLFLIGLIFSFPAILLFRKKAVKGRSNHPDEEVIIIETEKQLENLEEKVENRIKQRKKRLNL